MDSVEHVFSRICRGCKCEDPDMQSIFASSQSPEESARIDEMLMACASVQVNLGDGLPDLICLKCIDQLKISYFFKLQCEKTDSSLREYAKINGKDDVKPIIHPTENYLGSIEDFLEKPHVPKPTPTTTAGEGPCDKKEENDGETQERPVPSDTYDFIQILDNNQMLLTCRECSKIFTTLEGLKCHKRKHSGILFKCKFCDKEYTRKNHLERHEATHGKRKVHVCRICNKTLTRFEHLKRHLATHLREKPYTCQTCNRGFSRLEHLNNHALRCKGDRVHICNICNKAFNRADSLEVHSKLHTVEKPVLPTLENLDNIEQHYYEIDYDKNMEFSDTSDTEDFDIKPDEMSQDHLPAESNMTTGEIMEHLSIQMMENGTQQEPATVSDDDDFNDVDNSVANDVNDVVNDVNISDAKEANDANDTNDVTDVNDVNDDRSSSPEEKMPLASLIAVTKQEVVDDYVEEFIPDIELDDDRNNDDSNSDSEYTPTKVVTPKKRGRGRPRKHPPKVTGRKRGRPPTKHLKKDIKREPKEPKREPKEPKQPKKEPKREPSDYDEEEGRANNRSSVYVCPADDCVETFDTERKLEKHARTHEGLRLHACPVCTKEFARSNHLKRHMKSHSLDKPFQCVTCKKSFNRKDHLTQHQKLHERSQEFKCEVCQKAFYKLDQLAKHQASKHGIGERLMGLKKYECHICNKSFTTEKYRDIHVKGHLGEKQHECRTCSKVFLSKSHLTEHMKFHNENSKKFLCSECGQRFIRNDYLVIHMRRHRGEKPFKCKFCGKGFPRTTDLTVHERYHTGEKTHLCTICGRGFGRAYNLTVHMRTHTGEKPYQCTYCDAAFAQGNDLKAHVRRHTGERFHCELCPESFLMGYLLTQHKRAVHGLNVVSNIRRLNPVHKKEEDPNDPPPITIPLPKPIVSDPLMAFQAHLTVAQLQHHLVPGGE